MTATQTWIFNDGAGSLLDVSMASLAAMFYRLKELLKTAGWIHEASSDGTNVSNTSGNANDQITSAGEMATNNAWYVLRQPAIARGHGYPGNRQIIVRRGTADTNWLVAYVPANTDGTKQAKTANGTTTAIPTFTTTQFLQGTAPDTAANTGNPSGRNYAFGADNVAPYGFYLASWNTTTGINGAQNFFFDPLIPGTYDAADLDPAVICFQFNNSLSAVNGLAVIDTALSSPTFYTRYGLSGATWLQGGVLVYGFANASANGGFVVPKGIGRGQYGTLKEGPLPFFYAYGGENGSNPVTALQPNLVKGAGYIFRWKMGNYPTGLLLTRKSAGDRCVISDVTVPWDGSTTIVLTGINST